MTQDLIKGLQAFKHHHYGDNGVLMPELAKEGQRPKYFIISCIDSRCNPGTIFRAKPGVFFAHKAMGAIVRPYKKGTALAAALQFALHHMGVETVIVLGHTGCGAIKALVEDIEDEEIASFVNVAQHGLEQAKKCCAGENERIAYTERATILESAENLKSYPSVAQALDEKRVTIKAWQFDIQTGNLFEYNEDADAFCVLTPDMDVEESRLNAY